MQILRTAGTIIALVIGAAFATGQEALQFFVAEGLMGIGGLAITLLIGVHMSVTLLAGDYRRYPRSGVSVARVADSHPCAAERFTEPR